MTDQSQRSAIGTGSEVRVDGSEKPLREEAPPTVRSHPVDARMP